MRSVDHMTADAKFIRPPYRIKALSAPKILSCARLASSRPRWKRTPAVNPTSPMANICHGVHGPCANSTLEASIVTAPTRNPVSPPKATPARIAMAITGLNCGSMKKTARPATPMAHSTAITTSSRACGFRPSKTRKNGAMHSSSTNMAVR